MYGVEVLDDTLSETSCKALLTYEDTSTVLTTVAYRRALTPALDAVTPRYGTETGNTVVTFTGTGFSDSATTTVTIDDKPCTVIS